MPSRTTPDWVEQFGRVAVEAMACGVPVVASDSGALPDVVGDAGLLVPPGRRRRPAPSALDRMLGDVGPAPGGSREAGLRSRAECRWDVVADRYVDIYRRVTRTGDTVAAHATGRVEVVVVAYGHPSALARGPGPARRHCPSPSSTTRPRPQVRQVCADLGVRYLDAGRNGGFGGGVNLALATGWTPRADVLLVNPDAVRRRATTSPPCTARCSPTRRWRRVGPAQVDDTGSADPGRLALPVAVAHVGRGRRSRPRRRDRADFAIGSVLLLRSEALDHVGGFDERFFLYAEETDWAYRAARLGWRHAVVPSVTAIHVGAGDEHRPGPARGPLPRLAGALPAQALRRAGWQVARAGQLAGSAARSVLPGGRGVAARDRLRRYLRGPVGGRTRIPKQ